MTQSDATIVRDGSRLHGRITGIVTGPLEIGAHVDFDQELSIDFPAMPDSIELSRSAEYTVTYPTFLADGIHQFKGTRALEIPFSFKLHSFDLQYCPKGAFTLLQVAARLHALIVPINTGIKEIPAKAGKVKFNDDSHIEFSAETADGGSNVLTINGNKIAPPMTCRLELMATDMDNPGIACSGYVREVSVKLNGPWLRGPGNSYNLPSSGDFSFIFVHNPGHGNAHLGDIGVITAQAYSGIVRKQLYNTRQLADIDSFQGIDDPPEFISVDSPPATGERFTSTDSPPASGNRIR